MTVEGADSTAEVDACTLSGCKGPVVFVGDQATAAVVNSHLTGSATSHGVMAEGAGTAVQVSRHLWGCGGGRCSGANVECAVVCYQQSIVTIDDILHTK